MEDTKQEKEPEGDTNTVEEPDAVDMISKANEAADRLEKANEKLSKLLVKQESMQVEATLAGKSTAGVTEKTKEEKSIESAKKFLKGTGYEDELFG